MTATETLKHEHRVIELVLGAIDREARKADQGEPVDPSFFAQAIEFIRTFADRCHHGKEEGILFKAMAEKGVPVQGGPIGVMLGDHEEGRRFVRAAREALDHNDLRAVAENLMKYTALLRQHIMKEDNVLYPMAEQVMSPDEMDDLVKRFETVEREEMGEGTHERYHQLAHTLAGAHPGETEGPAPTAPGR
ncbi:MAG: hemerythrin domain-containing protein [Bacillota bacterium]